MREVTGEDRIPINHLVGIIHGLNHEDIYFGYVRKIVESQTGITYFIQVSNGGDFVQHSREQITPVVLKPENYGFIRD